MKSSPVSFYIYYRVAPSRAADARATIAGIMDALERQFFANHSFAGLPAAEPIDVPGHRGHRSDPLQIPQDLDVPDVAGVEDVARAGECRADLGPQEPVGVGEDADAHPIFLPGVAGPCNKP